MFVVNGAKTLISGATRADYLLTAVRTGGAGSGGLSLLLIEADRPGVSTASIAGLHWYNRNNGSIRFENVEVPVDHLIGVENKGFAGRPTQSNTARYRGPAATLALARAAMAEAIAFARQRQTFGRRVIDHQAIRHKFVAMIQRVDMTYAYLDTVVWRFEQGETPVAELSMLKVAANKALQHCAQECMQVLGGSAYTGDSPVERIYREARSFAVAGGAEEVLFDLAARQLGF
jgi:acyl-CoA dehydrogenase